jgi:cardiolipin synthase A/B
MHSFFFWVGVLTVVTVVVSLFFALGRRPSKIWAHHVPAVDEDDFLFGIAGTVNSPLQSGGKAELLDNGDQFFPALLAALRGAKQTINFMVYIWEPGKISDQIFEVLTERARAGVHVRILLDGLGGFRTPKKGVRELRAAGGKVARFRLFRLGSLMRFHKRNHRRAIVIDGCVGFTGGMAVGDKWLGDGRSGESWRDSMVRVTGSLAGNLQSTFAELWAYCCGEILLGPAFYPPEEQKGPLEQRRPRHACVISSPSSEEHPLRLFYLLSFLAARRTLYITSPYFVPDSHLRESVCQKARDGVDVRLLLPNRKTDAKPIRWASHSYFQDLLDAGVRIFEYQPTMMHNKNVVVDGKWSVVGSANMDIRSKELNDENVLGILDERLAGQIQKSFLADLALSKEIVSEEWGRRGLGRRVAERIAVLFAEQY